MLIEGVMNIIYTVLDKLLVLNIPALPDEVMGYIDTFFGYMEAGAGILANYTPLGYLLVLFGVLVAVDAGIIVYHLVMWILRKIPFLGVD